MTHKSPERVIWAASIAIFCFAVSATVVADELWREFRGEHFSLRARASVKSVSALACEVEGIGYALDDVSGGRLGATVSVVAVDNERDLRELLPQFWERRGVKPLGAYWSGVYGHHIVLRIDVSPGERMRRILHEYAHFVTHATYPEAPPWFDEGLSELWTNARLDGDQIEVGAPIRAHLKLLENRARWMPLRELAGARALPAATDPKAVAQYYAESWALLHYLVFERGGGRLVFDRVPRYEELPSDAVLQDYIGRVPLSSVRVPVARRSCAIKKPEELARLNALLEQARAVVDGARPIRALPLLDQASAMAPANAEVIEAKGLVAFLSNDAVAAAALFDQAIAVGGASHLSYYYRTVVADAAPMRIDGSGRVPVTDYLRQALLLNPDFVAARERLDGLANHP